MRVLWIDQGGALPALCPPSAIYSALRKKILSTLQARSTYILLARPDEVRLISDCEMIGQSGSQRGFQFPVRQAGSNPRFPR